MKQLQLFNGTSPIHFDGSDYQPQHDYNRLTGQIKDIYEVMRDGRWRTLSEIEHLTGHPGASISAQLRNLRKPRYRLT
jgi:hypothetical protein